MSKTVRRTVKMLIRANDPTNDLTLDVRWPLGPHKPLQVFCWETSPLPVDPRKDPGLPLLRRALGGPF